MTTIGEQQFMNAVPACLNRIANCLEEIVLRQRQQDADVDPKSLGALALWRQEVFSGRTLLGFGDWLAWHNADKTDGVDDEADPDRTKDLEGEPT